MNDNAPYVAFWIAVAIIGSMLIAFAFTYKMMALEHLPRKERTDNGTR